MRSSRKILNDLVTARREVLNATRSAMPSAQNRWDLFIEEAIQWQRGLNGMKDHCTECGREQLVRHMECPPDDPANLICGTCHARQIKEDGR